MSGATRRATTTARAASFVAVVSIAAFSAGGGCRVDEESELEDVGDLAAFDTEDRFEDELASGEVMGRLRRLNRVIIEYGEYAKAMAVSGEVRSYADRLVRDHERIMALVDDASRRLALDIVEPEPPSPEVQAKNDAIRRGLVRAGGLEIDRRFLWIMIRLHHETLDWLERERSLVDPELRRTLDRIDPILRQDVELGHRLLGELPQQS